MLKPLEKELDDQKMFSCKDLQESQQKSEDALQHLKSVYNLEKQRLEQRLIEEKEKWEARLTQQQEDSDAKIKEMESWWEEERDEEREEGRRKEEEGKEERKRLENEVASLRSSLQSSEQSVLDLRSLLSASETHSQSINQLRLTYEGEIKGLTEKLQKSEESRLFDSIDRNRLEESGQKNQETLKKKLEETVRNYEQEKKRLVQREEEQRSELAKIADELMERKIEFAREIALERQQGEFLRRKVEELQKQNDNVFGMYEEKMSKNLYYNFFCLIFCNSK